MRDPSTGGTTSTKISIAVLVTSVLLYYIFFYQEESLWSLLRSISGLIPTAITAALTSTTSSNIPMTDAVLKGLLKREKSASVRPDASIAIGFGACTDLVVDSLEIFDKFAAPANPQPHSQIETMQDLLELFAFYFKNAAASE